jgi:hypothetical protein
VTHFQPLFRSVSAEGGVYLFVIEGEERWTIRLDDEVIASGPTDDSGIMRGIAAFRALPAVRPPRTTLRAAS